MRFEIRHRSVAALGVFLLAAPLVAAQGLPVSPQTPRPPRDAAAPPGERTGTAVLRGRVTAIDGERPLRRVQVTISSPALGSPSRRTASTGLDGRYEFKSLPAGRYRVTVSRSGYLPLEYGQRRPGEQGRPVELGDGEALEKVDFVLPRMSVISGRITDETSEPIEDVSVFASRLLFYDGRRRLVPVSNLQTRTDDAGEYRISRLPPGQYIVMASTREKWTVRDKDGETVFGYMPTYFPGVSSGSDARRVTVGVGQEASGTDFSLNPGRAARISGTAMDSQGRPFTSVSLGTEIRGLQGASFGSAGGASVKPDGTFVINEVVPGEYTLSASRRTGDPSGQPEVAEVSVVVDGNDVESIALVGSTGATVSGRVLAEGEPAPKLSTVTLVVGEVRRSQASPAVLGAFRNDAGYARVMEDGTFTVEHVFGRARIRVTAPDGWMLKSVTYDGHDVADAVLDVRSGQSMTDMEVVLTNRVTVLSGVLATEAGAPIRDATVLVFSARPELWSESSRWVRAARPDQQGRWEIKALPPGEYLAIAQDFVEDGAWNDPDYLEALRKSAEPIAITEGRTHTASLRVVVPK